MNKVAIKIKIILDIKKCLRNIPKGFGHGFPIIEDNLQ